MTTKNTTLEKLTQWFDENGFDKQPVIDIEFAIEVRDKLKRLQENNKLKQEQINHWLEATNKKATRIAKLYRKINELQDQLRWRKWPEEKPDESGRYFVAIKKHFWLQVEILRYDEEIDHWFVNNVPVEDIEGLAAWKPLPKPPAAEGGE